MKITLASVLVSDQAKALDFYTNKLGFVKKVDIPLGPDQRWLTVVSPEAPEGTQLVLEPEGKLPETIAFKIALKNAKIPFTAFEVRDIHAEFERLKGLGVVFTKEPTQAGPVWIAIFDDTCGNLIQIYQMVA